MNFDEFIDDIAEKYGYDEELVSALKRCLPVMAAGKDQESIQLLKDTLERVEIVVFEDLPTREQLDELMNKKINGRNDHVTFIDKDRGEYNKSVSSSAYMNNPILDEDMNVVDRVWVIYTTKLKEYDKCHEAYGSMINLSHLIHEIGHAWAAQKDEFIQKEDGTIINRVGVTEIISDVDKENNTIEEKEIRGLYIEEATNTLEEEKALCKLLKVSSIEEIPGYLHSPYQWKLVDLMYILNNSLDLNMLEQLRLHDDKSVMKDLNELFKKTKHFENIKTKEYRESKEKIFKSYRDDEKMSDNAKSTLDSFFEKYHDLFFGRHDNSDFMEYFDGLLESFYNLREYKYSFYDEKNQYISPSYTDILKDMQSEGMNLINEMVKVRSLGRINESIDPKSAMIYSLKDGADVETVKEAENNLAIENDKNKEEKDIEGDQ